MAPLSLKHPQCDRTVWKAMGSTVELVLTGGSPELITVARTRLDDLEKKWSRFLPDSEITRLNAAQGCAVRVSVDTMELIECALLGWRASDGRFDPTVGSVLVSLGYDRDLSALWGDGPVGLSGTKKEAGNSGGSLNQLVLSFASQELSAPENFFFDPGGIGKGLAADILCRELLAEGAEGVMVSIGGDVRIDGPSPLGSLWQVAVDLVSPDQTVVKYVDIEHGAVATSSTLRRRWDHDGVAVHHVIDPRTRQSADVAYPTVAAVAGAAWWAEVAATCVMLGGDALSETTTIMIDHDGNIHHDGKKIAWEMEKNDE